MRYSTIKYIYFILTLFPLYRIEYQRNLPIKGRIMVVSNAIAKAALVHGKHPRVEDTCISLWQGSDFITSRIVKFICDDQVEYMLTVLNIEVKKIKAKTVVN